MGREAFDHERKWDEREWDEGGMEGEGDYAPAELSLLDLAFRDRPGM